MSQIVVIPIVGFLFFNSSVAGLFGESEDSFSSLATISVASIVAWTFFTVMGLIINSALASPSRWRTAAVLAVFGLTEVVRISAIYELPGDENFGAEYSVAFRITGAFATGLVLFGLASVAVGDYRDYRESYRRYAQRLGRLAAALQETQSHVELVRAQFGLSVRRLLTQNVSNAFKMGTGSSANHGDVANELFRISDELVRPLSHGLSDFAPVAPRFDVDAEAPRVPFKVFAKDVTSHAPFSAVSQTVIVTVLTAPLLFLLGSLQALGLWLLFIAMVFGAQYFGQRVMTPLMNRLPIVLRVIVITPLFSAPHSFFTVVAIAPGLPPGAGSLASILVYTAVLGAILGWLPAIADGVQFARQRFIDGLGTVDAGLARAQVRAQSQLWLDQKRLALTLHTDVQGAILAAALQLQKAVAAGGTEAELVLPKVKRTIAKSLQLTQADPKASRLSTAVSTINKTWSSLVSLTLDAPKDVTAALESDPLALEVVCELIRELHMNSFKHGRASECVITLSVSEAGNLHLQMTNNGSPLGTTTPEGGLGASFFASVTLSHTAKNVPGGVQIDLEVPLEVTEAIKTGKNTSASRG